MTTPTSSPARSWAVRAAIGVPAVVLTAAVGLFLAGRLGALEGRPRATLGVVDGRLAAPSKTDNSVSSQADAWPDHPLRDAARIAPLPAVGGMAATMGLVRTAAMALPGATLVAEAPDYLRFEYRTAALRFVDDAEFWFDPAANLVQVRSASRIGRRDFGVNRARIEAIRARLAAGH